MKRRGPARCVWHVVQSRVSPHVLLWLVVLEFSGGLGPATDVPLVLGTAMWLDGYDLSERSVYWIVGYRADGTARSQRDIFFFSFSTSTFRLMLGRVTFLLGDGTPCEWSLCEAGASMRRRGVIRDAVGLNKGWRMCSPRYVRDIMVVGFSR